MKKIIVFFAGIYKWFLSLFKRKEKETLVEQVKKVKKTIRRNNPVTPSHNNRKPKKGRSVQYIDMGDGSGRKRAIYHSAK